MIRFACECGKQLQAREEFAGQSVVCPACQREIPIPDVGGAIQAGQPPPTAPASDRLQRSRPGLGGEEYDRPAGAPVTSGKSVASLVLGILSLLTFCLTGIPAIIFGILGLRDVNRSRGRVQGHGLAVTGLVLGCLGTLATLAAVPLGLLLPAVQKVREAAARTQSANNLKQMTLAMHTYQIMYNRFPAAAICDRQGKPLLSWRVALLPYIEQENLYRQFKLDEPWDGPNNRRLLAMMPKVYRHPSDTKSPPDHTVYQVFVGNGAAFEQTQGLTIGEFPDGTANTIAIVEAGQAVPWTKPEDLPYDPNRPLPPLGGLLYGGFNAAAMDGSVHFVPQKTPESQLRPLITRNDGFPAFFP